MKKVFILLLITASFGFCQTGVKNPSIMIIPSDNLLYQLGCLKIIENQNQKEVVRLYSKALRENNDLLLAIQSINEKFLIVNYPTKSLEQVLKHIDTKRTANLLNGVYLDPRQLLLENARPDIVIDLSYEFKVGGLGSQLSFILSATDSYSNKIIASIGSPGIRTTNTNISQMISDQVELNLSNFLNQMQNHFESVIENGRKISLIIHSGENSFIDLELNQCNGEYLSEYIQNQIKENSFKKQFQLVGISSSEIRYEYIAIPLYDQDGVGIDARDWLKPLVKSLRQTCYLKVLDRTVGLGDGLLLIN